MYIIGTVLKEIISTNGKFSAIRAIFEKIFKNIVENVRIYRFSLEDLKLFVKEYAGGYLPQISTCITSNDVLELVYDKCTLIDINYLEAVVRKFGVKGAIVYVQCFNVNIEELCKYVPVRDVLEEKFFLSRSNQPLRTDVVIKMTLDHNPDHCTLQFIKDSISTIFGALAKSVQLVNIKEINKCILVTCFFPNCLSAFSLMQETAVDFMKRRGLVELTIDDKIYWKREKVYINCKS